MTHTPHRQLTDGRLTNNRIGASRGNQSNYLVSNDGVQTMDLPRNFSAPRSAEPSNRKTPILIPPIKYIVYNNPQVAYDFLISKGFNVEPTIPSTLQFAMSFIKQKGDEGILEFVNAAHPDKEVILKASGNKESSFSEEELTQTETKPEIQSQDLAKTEPAKTENKVEGWIKMNTQTIIIILFAVILFLALRPARS